jgi:hypothetical protein
LNLVGAYAYFANIGDLDGWASCFAAEATFRVSAPGIPGEPLTRDLFIAAERQGFAHKREVRADPFKGERRIFRIANTYVLEQTATRARITCELQIVRSSPTGPAPWIWLGGTYEGDLRKTDGEWRIQTWAINTDRVPDETWAIDPTT